MARGNGHWQGWQPSTGAHYVDPMTARHEGDIAYLSAEVEGLKADMTEVREDQHQHHSLLMDLRDAFTRHTSRSLAQIVRARWDELMGYLVIAAAGSYASQDMIWKLWLWASGTHPDL